MEQIAAYIESLNAVVKRFGLSAAKIAGIAVAAVFGLFALLSLAQFGFIYAIYSMIDDWVAVRLGFDVYISGLAATVFTSVFTVLFPTLCWYLFLGKRKGAGIGAVVGTQILICVSVYTIGSGVCFDRRTGKPMCWYADTPHGRVWSYSPGFDPNTGREFRLYTREIKEAEDARLHPKK